MYVGDIPVSTLILEGAGGRTGSAFEGGYPFKRSTVAKIDEVGVTIMLCGRFMNYERTSERRTCHPVRSC